MTLRRGLVAIGAALAILGGLVFAYAYIHGYLSPDSDELSVVALDPSDPARTRIGRLEYRGGLDIPRMGQNIGGLSGLRWDPDSGRLLAITDDARWVWITPDESDEQLTGIAAIESGDLLGLQGEILTGKEQGDSESLTRSVDGGWLIGFERDHRVWRYPDLTGRPEPTAIDPEELLGPLGENNGLEALASSQNVVIGCAEQVDDQAVGICFTLAEERPAQTFPIGATSATGDTGALPTDADMSADGMLFVLWRSYSPADGNAAMIHIKLPGEPPTEVMVLRPPLSVDNFEGLAVREETTNDGQSRTFLYIVSDDNFSGGQRTLLMKFEVVVE